MKRTSEFGSLYKGREGQWSWIAHRVTGVAILAFLFVHIVDTALVAWGPSAYNKVVAVYHHPIIQIMDYVRRPGWRLAWDSLLGIVRVTLFALGTIIVFTFDDGSVRMEYKPVKLGSYVPMERKY